MEAITVSQSWSDDDNDYLFWYLPETPLKLLTFATIFSLIALCVWYVNLPIGNIWSKLLIYSLHFWTSLVRVWNRVRRGGWLKLRPSDPSAKISKQTNVYGKQKLQPLSNPDSRADKQTVLKPPNLRATNTLQLSGCLIKTNKPKNKYELDQMML